MSNLSDLEARMFNQIPGGYTFRPPSLCASKVYRVTESQKAEILAVITRPRSRRCTLAFPPALRLLVGAVTVGVVKVLDVVGTSSEIIFIAAISVSITIITLMAW